VVECESWGERHGRRRWPIAIGLNACARGDGRSRRSDGNSPRTSIVRAVQDTQAALSARHSDRNSALDPIDQQVVRTTRSASHDARAAVQVDDATESALPSGAVAAAQPRVRDATLQHGSDDPAVDLRRHQSVLPLGSGGSTERGFDHVAFARRRWPARKHAYGHGIDRAECRAMAVEGGDRAGSEAADLLRPNRPRSGDGAKIGRDPRRPTTGSTDGWRDSLGEL